MLLSHPHRRYLAALLGILLLGAGGIAATNALIDPLWFFTHEHLLNRVQPGFDERAQKTNWLQSRSGQFNAVMFGSSRSTYIDQGDFRPLHLFNYSVNAMWPSEYQSYLDHFRKANGREPEYVVLGVDFFGSHGKVVGQWESPQVYMENADNPRYRISALLSFDLLWRSARTVAHSLELAAPIEQLDYYDRHNIRHMRNTISSEDRADEILGDLDFFHRKIYSDYYYNNDLPRIWADLRLSHPHTQFLVFTTPIAEPMFALLIREGRLEDYQHWLTDLTATFGEVWDFMGLNSVTTDLTQYRDAQHFHPRIGTMIVDRLLGRPVAPEHADFGRLVTRQSLPEHMAFIRSQSACVDADPIRTARARLERATERLSAGRLPEPMSRATGDCHFAAASGEAS